MNKFISKRGQVSNFIVMDLFDEAQELSRKGKLLVEGKKDDKAADKSE